MYISVFSDGFRWPLQKGQSIPQRGHDQQAKNHCTRLSRLPHTPSHPACVLSVGIAHRISKLAFPPLLHFTNKCSVLSQEDFLYNSPISKTLSHGKAFYKMFCSLSVDELFSSSRLHKIVFKLVGQSLYCYFLMDRMLRLGMWPRSWTTCVRPTGPWVQSLALKSKCWRTRLAKLMAGMLSVRN